MIYKYFFFFLFILFAQNASALRCHQIIKHSYQENKNINISTSETHFEVREKKQWFKKRFFFLSHIKDGSVFINTFLKDGKRHSTLLSGKTLFDHMLNHFTDRHEVKYIMGHWFNYSDNHKVFTQALDEGDTPSEAALKTWTGKQAARYGYKFASVNFLMSREMDPNFDSYLVRFSKNPFEASDHIVGQMVSPNFDDR